MQNTLKKSAPTKRNAASTCVVSQRELDSIKMALETAQLNEAAKIAAEAEKQLQRTRVQEPIPNSICQQHIEKRQAAQRKRDLEELDRQKVDAEFAEEESQRRKEAIEHARKLVFYQKEKVRAVHSLVLQDMVLAEREEQIKYKNEKKKFMSSVQDQWQEAFNKEEDMKQQALDQKRKAAIEAAKQTALDQEAQHEFQIALKEQEKVVKANDRDQLMELGRQHAQDIATKEHNAQRKQQQLLDDMEQLKIQSAQLKAAEDAKWKTMEYSSQKWHDLKEKRTQEQKAIDTKRIKEQIEVRDRMGRAQWDHLESERSKKDRWVEARVLEIQDNELFKAEQKRTAMELAKQQMKMDRDKLIAKRAQDALEKKEHNLLVVQSNEQMRKDAESDRILKRDAIREKSFNIQKTNEDRIAKKLALTNARVEDEKIDAKRHLDQELAEKEELKKYVVDILSESWMANNPHKKDVSHYVDKAWTS